MPTQIFGSINRLAKRAKKPAAGRAARKLVLALAVSFLAGLTAVPAEATVLPVEGGPGGGYFRDDCPPGQYLVGFSVGAGAWIDRIAVLCAGLPPGQASFGNRTSGAFHGGPGGGPQEAYCPGSHYGSWLLFGYTRKGNDPLYIDFVELGCHPVGGGEETSTCIATGGGCWKYRPGAPPPLISIGTVTVTNGLPAFLQQCPAEEAATGIHGRSGAYLDAVGLICGPRPTVVATAPKPIKKLGKAKPSTSAAVTQAPITKLGNASAAVETAPKPIKKLGKAKSAAPAEAEAPPAPPAEAPVVTAAVTGDVDVYDVPDGVGTVIGMLEQGSNVPLLAECRDGWCQVQADVPGGKGWVWGEFLAF